MALSCPVIVRTIDTTTHADGNGVNTVTTVGLAPQAGGSIQLTTTILIVTVNGGVPAGVNIGSAFTLSIG